MCPLFIYLNVTDTGIHRCRDQPQFLKEELYGMKFPIKERNENIFAKDMVKQISPISILCIIM